MLNKTLIVSNIDSFECCYWEWEFFKLKYFQLFYRTYLEQQVEEYERVEQVISIIFFNIISKKLDIFISSYFLVVTEKWPNFLLILNIEFLPRNEWRNVNLRQRRFSNGWRRMMPWDHLKVTFFPLQFGLVIRGRYVPLFWTINIEFTNNKSTFWLDM